jgi:hypothetical protein
MHAEGTGLAITQTRHVNTKVPPHMQYTTSPKQPLNADRRYLALGLEGSANKLGAGIIEHALDGSASVLSNVRHTYITPPGSGFLPRDTAKHHREWVLNVIRQSLSQAAVSMADLDCICYTKGIVIEFLLLLCFHAIVRPWNGRTAPFCCTRCSRAISSI